jgi:hypothetical protein
MLRARRDASSELERTTGTEKGPRCEDFKPEERRERRWAIPIEDKTEAAVHDLTPAHAATVVEGDPRRAAHGVAHKVLYRRREKKCGCANPRIDRMWVYTCTAMSAVKVEPSVMLEVSLYGLSVPL